MIGQTQVDKLLLMRDIATYEVALADSLQLNSTISGSLNELNEVQK